MDTAGVSAEDITHDAQVLGGIQHQPAGLPFGDLDVAVEHGRVPETQLEAGNGHGLGDGTEVEDALLADGGEIEETLVDVVEGIEHHLGAAVEGSFAVLGAEEVLEAVDVLGPDFLGPKVAAVMMVLADVADDVRLLKEEAHGVVEAGALQQARVAEFGLDEEASEPLADEAGDVVAVEVVLLIRPDTGVLGSGADAVISHAVAHLASDVPDDEAVERFHLLEFGDDVVELNEDAAVLLLRAIPVKRPPIAVEDVGEAAEQGFLSRKREGWIVFDGVEATQDEVEDADGDEQLGMDLLDDGAEAATGLIEEAEADTLCLRLCCFIAFMDGVVPDFPTEPRVSYRGEQHDSTTARQHDSTTVRQHAPLDHGPQL